MYISALSITNTNKTLTNSQEIASYLLEIKAIKLSPNKPFTWASGLQSPIYCDNRLLLSYPEIRNKVVGAFCDLIQSNFSAQIIAGVATAGIAHGVLVADRLNLPFVYVRSKVKGHGRQNQIEGELTIKEDVLLIEDLISTGGSVLAASEALIEEGVGISGACAIFSYGFEKAKANFKSSGISYATITDYDTMLEVAVSQKYIDPNEQSILKEWRKDPVNWSNNINV